MKHLTFQNGDQMPFFGLGTWKSAPQEAYEAVLEAIKAGYRHIDCAHIYKNETEIGEALSKAFKEGLVKREELWITSKLWNDCHEEQHVLPAVEQTLKDLQLDYLDLYLIHWPVAVKKGIDFASKREDFLSPAEAPLSKTWAAMEKAVDLGLTRHIGVSNFNTLKLKEILKSARLQPEMNQVELHPFLQQNNLLDFCKENNIHLTAYAPLGSAYRVADKEVDFPILLEDDTLNEIATKHQATPAQIAISWGIHRGTAVIPKSVKKSRILENLKLFGFNWMRKTLDGSMLWKGPIGTLQGKDGSVRAVLTPWKISGIKKIKKQKRKSVYPSSFSFYLFGTTFTIPLPSRAA